MSTQFNYIYKNVKILLYLLTILKYDWPDTAELEKQTWLKYCQTDIAHCPMCFHSTAYTILQTFHNHIKVDQTISSEINKFFGTRRLQYGTYGGQQAVFKHLMDEFQMMKIKIKVCEYVTNCDEIWEFAAEPDSKLQKNLEHILSKYFVQHSRLGHLQIYPEKSINRLMSVIGQAYKNSIYKWIMMNINPEPMILQILSQHEFPVPRILCMCGFVMVQTYDGLPLNAFYEHSFGQRVFIAKQMIEAALKFTYGIESFR